MNKEWRQSILKNVEVSNLGELRDSITHDMLEQTHNFRGSTISYCAYKNRLVHRLVAIAFVPNSQNLPEVNHKDCNPTNNNVDNLEWCTHKQNEAHKYSGPNAERNKAVQKELSSRSKGSTGKHWKKTDEQRAEQSKRMKGVFNSNNRLGSHHSEETKRKMSEARKAYYEKKRQLT